MYYLFIIQAVFFCPYIYTGDAYPLYAPPRYGDFSKVLCNDLGLICGRNSPTLFPAHSPDGMQRTST